MGSALSSNLEKVVTADAWSRLGRGPQLRQLFGAYRSTDCWAVKRKFVAIDDGDGYVSYDEMQQLCYLPEFSLLFIWDNFAQQNELVDARELLAIICIFSSARLDEKARFLCALFDASACGRNTGAEIAQLCTVVLGVFARCNGVVVKPKDVFGPFKAEFADLCPEIREPELTQGFERAFKTERVVGTEQLDRMLPSVRAVYEALPTYGQPPLGAAKPPPPDWASAPAKEASMKNETSSKRKAPTKKKPESELAHLAWMNKLDEPAATEDMEGADEDNNESVHNWLVMNGKDFATIARDVPGFQRLFVKCVAQSLGLPADCVDVVNVTSGSIVVEFRLYVPGHGADPRSVPVLFQLLQQQLRNPHSALRRGPLGVYTDNTELLAAEPKRKVAEEPSPVVSPSAGGYPQPFCAGEVAQMWEEKGTQAMPSDFGTPRPGKNADLNRESRAEAEMMRQIRETVKELDLVRQRVAKTEKASRALRQQAKLRDGVIAEFSAALEQQQKEAEDTITFEIDGTTRVARIIGSKKADVISLMTHHLEYLSGADGDQWVRLDEKKNTLTDEFGHGNVRFQRGSPG